MKKWILLLSLISLNTSAQTNIKKIDSLLSYTNHHDKMMGQFAIKLGNSSVYNKTFGSDKFEKNPEIKIDNNTKYRIGSITKMFTATMIMQLVEEKKIKLTDKLSKFFPNVTNAKNITIEMMLAHRSGIKDYVNDPQEAITFHDLKLKQKDIINKIENYSSDFEPDTKTAYSNSNYYLLGLILEDITKVSYNTNLQNRICKPLKLKNTYLSSKPNNKLKNEIQSYTLQDNKWTIYPEGNYAIANGAGGILSTANDLTTYIQGLFSHKLVKKQTLDLMLQTKQGFGLGIAVIPFNDRKLYGHGGKIGMFESTLAYYPSEKIAFASLFNGVNTITNDVNIGILSIYYQQPYIFPDYNEVTVNNEILKSYEGIYSSKEIPMKINVFIKNNKLHAQATGQSDFQLTAKSETEFTFDPARIKIVFEKGKLTLNQSAMKIVFEKK